MASSCEGLAASCQLDVAEILQGAGWVNEQPFSSIFGQLLHVAGLIYAIG